MPMGEVVTFDGQPPAGCIHFGVGQPSNDLLPVELLARASEAYFSAAIPQELNYGECQGDARFRTSLASFLSAAYAQPVNPEALFLSAGNSQALDFVCERFTQPGDVVFVEEPTYFLAFQVFRDHGLNVVGIPMDEKGLRLDRLQHELERQRPALVYTIPSFHNPTGVSLAAERRQALAELSAQHGFLVVADEVYQLLHTHRAPPPPMAAWCEQGRVLSLGSFSKILAPGLRLGWIQTSADLMARLLNSGYINSGGSVNHLTSHLVRQALDRGWLSAFIETLRASYLQRVETMHQELTAQLQDQLRWVRPDGGYFFWLELLDGRDSSTLQERALMAGTGFQPGHVFSCRGGLEHWLRLSFAHYGCSEISDGIGRLAKVIQA